MITVRKNFTMDWEITDSKKLIPTCKIKRPEGADDLFIRISSIKKVNKGRLGSWVADGKFFAVIDNNNRVNLINYGYDLKYGAVIRNDGLFINAALLELKDLDMPNEFGVENVPEKPLPSRKGVVAIEVKDIASDEIKPELFHKLFWDILKE